MFVFPPTRKHEHWIPYPYDVFSAEFLANVPFLDEWNGQNSFYENGTVWLREEE